nr:O-antigen ligase family protein [uncultured Prevotella sp.]
MTLLTKIATNYFICAWVCMVVSSIFAISGLFMDSVYYPKWITTEVVVVFFVIFSVPFFLKKSISWRLVYKQICRFTNFIVFLEALFAIIQYTDLYTVNMGYSVGTFNNLAGLVACISISFPMGLVFLDEYGKVERILFYISKCADFFVLVLYGSRIGCVCMLFVFSLIFFRNIRYGKQIATIIGCLAFAFSACILKTQSTHGRLFIMERTVELIMKRLFFGCGSGGFTKEYMIEQAEYFVMHPDSKYVMLADNIHHPLNEFLLIATNFGVLGLLIVLVFCSVVFVYYRFHKTPYGREGCLILLMIILIALFSYPLSYPFTWLMLIISVVLIFSHVIKHIKNRTAFITLALGLWLSCFFMITPLRNELFFQLSWKNASESSQLEHFENMNQKYNALYQSGNYDYRFLYDYACEAFDKEQFGLALKLAKETESHVSDYELTLLIGDCYQSLDSLEDAIHCYEQAHYMCPSRLLPLYEMYNIYSGCNDTTNCWRLYAEISRKKIKVKNQVTDMILKDINQDIKRFYY